MGNSYTNAVSKFQIFMTLQYRIKIPSPDPNKHTPKEDYIGENSKNIEENIVLKIKEREEAI